MLQHGPSGNKVKGLAGKTAGSHASENDTNDVHEKSLCIIYNRRVTIMALGILLSPGNRQVGLLYL